MADVIERVVVLVRVHSPRLFSLLRKIWWLLRWRRLPPQIGRGLGQDHALYLKAMDASIARVLSSDTKNTQRLVVWVLSDVQTTPEMRAVTLSSLQLQSLPPDQIVQSGPAIDPNYSADSDGDVCVAVMAGAEIKPYALATLIRVLEQNPQILCIVPDHEQGEGDQCRVVPWLSAAVYTPRLWAWRSSAAWPDLTQPATVQGLAHLPAVLVREPARLSVPAVPTVDRQRQAEASISVIVPTRDGGAVLGECLRGVLAELETLDVPTELLVVDNGSCDPQTLTLLQTMTVAHPQRVRVLRYDHPFNYSAINNFAVRQATGEQILLLNDDIQTHESGWLAAMREELAHPGVAAVGARLLYPNGCLQHAGVALGLGGVAGHPGRTLAADDPRWCVWPHDQRRQVSAVTGACLLTRTALYWDVNGLNEDALSIAFNDVDFCLKLGQAGGAVIYTPRATLVHHESMSRGAEDTVAKQQRFADEIRYMQQSWPEMIADDPFYSAHLSRDLDDLSFREPCVSTLLKPRTLPPVLTF